MRILITLLILGLFTAVVLASDGPVRPTPVIRTVDPPSAKVGVELVASGDHLGKTAVDALYLTQGEATTKVAILRQTDTSITFKIPADTKAGRFGLMILTAGISPQFLDEPVFLIVQ